jgi:hypothetical protein
MFPWLVTGTASDRTVSSFYYVLAASADITDMLSMGYISD